MSWSVVAKHYLMESLGNLLWVLRCISSHVDDTGNMVYDEEVEFPYRTTRFDVYGSFYNTHTLFVGMVSTQLTSSYVMLVIHDFLYILNLNNK